MPETGKSIPRRAFGMGAAIVGAVGMISGFVLFYFLDPAVFYDLGLYVAIAGAVLLVYGLCQNFVNQSHENDIEISFKAVKKILSNNIIMAVLLIMVGIIILVQPRIMQLQVLLDILAQSSTKVIAALGFGFTLLIGGIDLSAGRLVGLAAVISASMLQAADYANRFYPELPQMELIVPILAAISVCMTFGAINGFLTAKCEMNPFIATLAVQMIVFGAASLYCSMDPHKSQSISGMRADLLQLGHYKLLAVGGFPGISILVPISVFFIFLIWLILNKTVLGKHIYAIGTNRESAAASGVQAAGTVMGIFILASALYGTAGILETARTAGASPGYGNGWEIDALAACAVGGVSLRGGSGKVSGIVRGVLILTVIQYGLQFIAADPIWQQVIKGMIIAAAGVRDLSKHRNK